MKRSFLLFGPPHIKIFSIRPYHGLRSGVYGGESRDCGEAAPGVPCVTPSSFHAGKKRALIANRGRRASARSGIMESSTKHPTPFLHAGINRRAAGSARASATIYPKGGPHGGPVAHLGWACRTTGSAQGGRRRAVGLWRLRRGIPGGLDALRRRPPPSGKIQRGEQSGADFRNGLLHGFRPSFRPLRRVSGKRSFFGRVWLISDPTIPSAIEERLTRLHRPGSRHDGPCRRHEPILSGVKRRRFGYSHRLGRFPVEPIHARQPCLFTACARCSRPSGQGACLPSIRRRSHSFR